MRLLAAALLIASTTAAAAASVEGEWVTEGDKARVKIEPCASDAQKLCGTITWSYRPADAPPGPLLDIHNSDAKLRSRPIVGLPLLEAMACRTPVVASSAGAAPEILEKAGGAIVPTGDPQAMAEALVRILRMPDRDWSDLSESARRTASAWSWERSSGLFEEAVRRAREEAPR